MRRASHGYKLLRRTVFLVLTIAWAVNALVGASADTATPPQARFVAYPVANPAKVAAAVGYNIFLKGVKKDQIDNDKTRGMIFSILRSARDDPGGVTLFFETPEGQSLPPDGKDTIKIQFKVGKSPKVVQFGEISNMRSTRGVNGTTIGELDKPVGAEVEGDPVYTAINADDQGPILLQGLQFWIDAPAVEDPSTLLDFSQPFGFGPTEPDIFLAANGGSHEIQVPGSIEAGNWLYARAHMADGGVGVTDFVYGFDTVPEPSALTASACALTALSLLLLRRVSRSS
jgi:hypothetical protein